MDRPISWDGPNFAIFTSVPYPLWVYDPRTLRVLAVNQACCERYAGPAAEATRLTVADLAAEEDRAEFLRWIETETATEGLFWRPRRVHQQRLDGTVFPAQILRGEGVVGKVAESARGIIVNNFRSSPLALPTELAETRIEALLAEPLVYRNRLQGVLVIGREVGGRPFRDWEQDIMRLFATQIGPVLDNARLVKDLEAELHDRQEAEAKLLRRTRQVEAVREIGNEVAREIDQNALMSLLASRVMALLDAGGSALYVWEDEEQTLMARGAQGLV